MWPDRLRGVAITKKRAPLASRGFSAINHGPRRSLEYSF
jgi:hypothetical protein